MWRGKINHYYKEGFFSSLMAKLKKISKETELTVKIIIIFIVISHIVILINDKIFSVVGCSRCNIFHFTLKHLYLVLIIIFLYIIIYKNFIKMKSYINLSIDEKNNSYSIHYENSILFRALFNKGREGAAFAEIEEEWTIGRFIDVNRNIIKTLDYTKNELLNRSIYDIVDKEQINEINLAIKQLKEQKQVSIETVAVSKNGNRIDLEVDGSLLELNGKKVVLLLSRNITDRKNVERALLESEERYRKLIELLPDAVHIKQDRRIVYSNDAGAKLLGVEDPKEFLGRFDCDFTHPDYRTMSRERGKRIIAIGEKVPIAESKIVRLDGQEVNVEVASTGIEYNGKTCILSVIRDITERKKAEAAIEAMINENKELLKKAVESEKSKTEFFTNISHEFKTPLNVILGIIQLLNLQMSNNQMDKVSYNKYIQMMKQNCYRLLRLINNLLDITKIDSGYMELNFKNHDIINIIEDVTLSVAEYAKNKGITIIFDTEIEEKVMCCDEEKIERIILNLLSNSIKYNKETGKIFVNVYDREEEILISVKDTGIGIPVDKLSEVFDRFKQVDTSLHRVNEGSGIGLALVKSIVEKHDGEIIVSSVYGEGTEFIVKLPVKILEEEKDKCKCDCSVNSLVERINIEFSDIYKLY